jgi:signal transduction histidine kinase
VAEFTDRFTRVLKKLAESSLEPRKFADISQDLVELENDVHTTLRSMRLANEDHERLVKTLEDRVKFLTEEREHGFDDVLVDYAH